MEKNDQNLTIKEFKNAMSERNYDEAVNLADLIDVKKVDDNNLLSLIADAYELSHDYELAKEVLLLAYEKTNAGRHLAYRLCLISIKTNDYDDAEEFYNDFVIMAPKDTSRYVLQYKMALARNESKEELIKILEEYVNIDMEEKWAFELAKLYKEVGQNDHCIEVCDEIGLWFPGGKYLARAMELKKSIAPLNITQQQMLDDSKAHEAEEKVDQNVDEKTAEETKPISKAKPHKTDSIVESIMSRQPEREEYKEPVEDILREVDAVSDVKLNIKKPSEEIAEAFDKTTEIKEITTDDNGEIKFEKPHKFDITEIKLAEPEKKEKSDLLSARVTSPDGSKFDVFDTSTFKKEEDGEVSVKKRNDMFREVGELPEKEPDFIPNVKDVEDILQNLRDRGILGQDTVDQAVQIIDNDESYVKSLIDDSDDQEEQEAQDSAEKFGTIVNAPDEELLLGGQSLDSEPDTRDEENLYTKEIDLDAIKNELNKSDDVEITPEEMEDLVEEADNPIEEAEDLVEKVEEPVEGVDGSTKIIGNLVEQSDESADVIAKTNIALGGEIAKAATGIIPTKDGIKIAGESTKGAKVLDEAVTPIIENGEEVPVLDLDLDIENDISDNNQEDGLEEETKEEAVVISMPVVKEGSAVITPIVHSDEHLEDEENVDLEATKEFATVDMENIIASAAEKLDEIKEEDEQLRRSKKDEKIDVTEEIKIDLDPDDMQAFASYLNVEGLEDSIKKVVIDLVKDFENTGNSSKGNVIIVGDHQTGKTTMAIEIIKLVNKKRGSTSRRIAKIDAITFNDKDFSKVVKKLVGCDLIIEDAHLLDESKVAEMIEGMKNYTDNMLVVLEGNTNAMAEMVKETEGMKEVFDHTINIKQYDIKEWVSFGKEYAKDKGYTFDDMAELAFYKAIDDTFGKNKGISQEDVENIVDRAISKNEKFKISGIFSSHKSEEGLKILEESNFN